MVVQLYSLNAFCASVIRNTKSSSWACYFHIIFIARVSTSISASIPPHILYVLQVSLDSGPENSKTHLEIYCLQVYSTPTGCTPVFFNTDELPRHNRLIRCPGWPVIGQTFKKWYENHPKVGYCFSKNQEPLLGDHQVRPSWPCTTQKSQIHYGQSFYCDFQLNLIYRGIEVAIQVCIIWYSRIGLLQ